MAMQHCFTCDQEIDLDRNVEHFLDEHPGGDIRPLDNPIMLTGYLCDYQGSNGSLCGQDATVEWAWHVYSMADGETSKETKFRCDNHDYGDGLPDGATDHKLELVRHD